MTAVPEKTLVYLGGASNGASNQISRLIVAGKYLKDGRIAFIDRKNSLLLITNTDDESIQEVDLIQALLGRGHGSGASGKIGTEKPGFYREQLESDKMKPGLKSECNVKPSDVNKGFTDDQLLVTYTGEDFSLAVVYQMRFEVQGIILQQVLQVKIMDRTRSVIVLDGEHLCATTPTKIVVLNTSGDCIALHNRSKRDRGGLLMSDGNGRFFYGDGDTFVGCYWDGSNIREIFRFNHSRMKFPRGSAVDNSGRIAVCCDSSHNIFRISSDEKESEIIAGDSKKSFGDIDFHPAGGHFITTFWTENEWPILFKMRA